MKRKYIKVALSKSVLISRIADATRNKATLEKRAFDEDIFLLFLLSIKQDENGDLFVVNNQRLFEIAQKMRIVSKYETYEIEK